MRDGGVVVQRQATTLRIGLGEDHQVPEDFEAETRKVYENIATTLGHFAATLANVVTQTIYVTDIVQGIATRALRCETFGGKVLPASILVEISKLAVPGARVEVAVTARLDV